MLVKHISELIGKTPLLEISPAVHQLKNFRLYAKLELLNPFGSVKDKSAWNMLKDDIEQIHGERKTVIETSSGNMAKAMTVICSLYDVPFKIVTDRIKVREVKQVLQLLGAQVEEVPGLSQCPDPTDPNNPITFIEQLMSANPGQYYYPSQYTNELNFEAHYQSTGKEIYEDLGKENLGKIDFFIGALGTAGSTRGAGLFLKEKNPAMKNIGVVSTKGHLLPGIRTQDELYEVGLFHKDFYDDIVAVEADESIDAMLLLIRKCGVLAGPTSGGSLAATLKYLKTIDSTQQEPQNVVFMVSDRVEWYLSYLQKARPELFGFDLRKDSIKALSAQEIDLAPEITVDKVDTWLESQKNPLIIDMRGNLAFKASRIPGSLNIPGDQLEEISDWGMPFSDQQAVLFVCPTGEVSKRYVAHFSKKGINAFSLAGGFVAWRDAGKVTERYKAKPIINNKIQNKSFKI